MDREVMTKTSYWDTGRIRPERNAIEGEDLQFRWSDVRATSTFERFGVGKTRRL